MDETYLVFLLNIQTGEEFVAPVTAPSRVEALARVSTKYPPQQLFAIQTCYPVSELQRLLAEAGRWPGMTSAAPGKDQVSRRISFGAALPPLPGQQPLEQAAPQPAAAEPAPEEPAVPDLAPPEAAVEATVEAQVEVIEEEAPVPAVAPTAPGGRRTLAASIISRKGPDPVVSAQEMLKALRH